MHPNIYKIYSKPSVGLMLVQRRRRWPNIKPTLGQSRDCWVFFIDLIWTLKCVYILTVFLLGYLRGPWCSG